MQFLLHGAPFLFLSVCYLYHITFKISPVWIETLLCALTAFSTVESKLMVSLNPHYAAQCPAQGRYSLDSGRKHVGYHWTDPFVCLPLLVTRNSSKEELWVFDPSTPSSEPRKYFPGGSGEPQRPNLDFSLGSLSWATDRTQSLFVTSLVLLLSAPTLLVQKQPLQQKPSHVCFSLFSVRQLVQKW